MTPQELERSLELPLCMDEERISKTVIETNRAPLVLAFAVELLRYTMPEQPLSSRLSLAQAVVSANSRSKAVSIGLEKGPSADEEGWAEGQPRVTIMGRTIAVLKRGGYQWQGEETVGEEGQTGEQTGQGEGEQAKTQESQAETETQASSATLAHEPTPSKPTWSVSQPISLKDSTFIARAVHMTDPSQRRALLQSLLEDNPKLKTATHNAWAYRVRPPEGSPNQRIREESFDDGETGCGDLMLRVMREAGAVDTLVVLTRWFGGTLLGPDRWRLMRNCVAGALSERLRVTGAGVTLGGEALWGLDLETARAKATVGGYGSGTRQHTVTRVVGMPIHQPESARRYLLRSFASAPAEETSGEGSDASATQSPKKAKTTLKEIEEEKEQNLGLLLGALRIVFDSWADHLSAAELDKRAWGWYVAVRPAVESGQAGWSAKGLVRLRDILALRRKTQQKGT